MLQQDDSYEAPFPVIKRAAGALNQDTPVHFQMCAVSPLPRPGIGKEASYDSIRTGEVLIQATTCPGFRSFSWLPYKD